MWHPSRRAFCSLFILVTSLLSLSYVTGGMAADKPCTDLPAAVTDAKKLLGETRTPLANAKKLLPALGLPADPELSSTSIARLAEGAKLWKAHPIGGNGGLDSKLKPLTEPKAETDSKCLDEALKAADTSTEIVQLRKDLADKTTAQETKKKELLAAQEKLKQLKEKMAPQAEIDEAQKALDTATAAAAAADKAKSDAAAALKKKQDPIDEAQALLTELKAGIEDAKKLRGTEGEKGLLFKAVKAFTGYGNKLSSGLGSQLDATQFPKLTSGKPTGLAAADALAGQLVAFGRAEILNRSLVKALAPIRQSDKLDEPGSGLLVEGLEPPDYVEATEMHGAKRDDKLCAGVREHGQKTQRCIEGFRGLYDAVRTACDVETGELLKYTRALREGLARAREGDDDRALPVPDETRMTLGRGLVTLINQADTAWPTLAAQLREVNDAAMKAAGESVVGARVGRDILSAALVGLDETYTGDAEGFVNEQVRLFYFTNVPRLLQSLRRNEVTILNPEGRAFVDRARTLQSELLKKEQEAFARDGAVADLKRQVIILQTELEVADKKLAAEQQAVTDANKILSDLVSKQALADLNKAKSDNAVTVKQQELTAAEKELADAIAAMMPQPVIDEKTAKVEKLKGELMALQNAVPPATADAAFAKSLTDDQRAAVGRAEEKMRSAQTRRDEVNRQLNNTEAEALGAMPQLRQAQQAVFELRQQLVLQARAEAEAFGEASDNLPIYFAPARAGSNDPLGRVMFFAYGDSKTLFLRGNPADVETALDVVAGFDRPAPQARVTLWTLQLNGRDPAQLNGSVRLINEEMRYLRANIIGIQDVLRNSVNQEVNSVAIGFKSLIQGTPLDMDQRLCRYMAYPREVRERLGLQLPYSEWHSTAAQTLRLSADLKALRGYVERFMELRALRKKQGLDPRPSNRLAEELNLVGEFGIAAVREVQASLGRVTHRMDRVKGLQKCYVEDAGGFTWQALKLRKADALCELKTLAKLAEEMAEMLAIKQDKATLVDNLRKLVKRSFKQLVPGDPPPKEKDTLDNFYGDTVLPAVRKGEESVQELQRILHSIAKGIDPDCVCDTSALGSRLNKLEKVYRQRKKQEVDKSKLAIQLLDLETVTRWTIPDPANSTTLGQTLFISSLLRRSCRLRVLRDFSTELIALSRQANAAAGKYSNGRDQELAKRRGERYDQFLHDSLAVARVLISGEDTVSLLGAANGNASSNKQAGSPTFPALPRTLFGALHKRESNLNDDEMTANQLEVLMALQAKGRHSCGLEVRSILRQIQRTQGLSGDQVQPGSPLVWQLREQYLPLLGWLSRSLVDSPTDFRDLDDQAKAGACYVPQPYRALGMQAVKMNFKQPVAADQMAWTIAALEGQRNSLTQSTARVAAADDMVKRLMVIVEDDVDHYFVSPALKALQDVIHDKPSTGERIGDKLAGLVGGTKPRVNFGLIERTSILATNRLVARVSPNASGDVTLKGPEDFLEQAQQLAQIAQSVNNSFFAPKRSSNAAKNGMTAAGAASALGASGASLGLFGGIGALLSLLDEQKEEPPGEVYALTSGNTFKLTPIFDPSGQALRFKFDYAAVVNVREPNGTVNPSIPRVDRHTVNTEVQVSNLEVREVSRFGVNAQLGLPEKRTGGVPIVRNLPILKDIPLIGYFTRQAAKGGLIQESVILGQTAIYPTVSEIVDLLVDVPQRTELGFKPPAYLRVGDRPTARETLNGLLKKLHLAQ